MADTSTQAYASSADAAKGLASAFNTDGNSLTSAQIAAINKAASLVPTVSASTLQSPQNPAQIPQPKTTDYLGTLASGNAIIGSNTSALSTPTTSTTSTDPFALLNSYLAGSTPPPSSSTQYATDYANAGIDAKTQAVNDAAAKVKAAQAKLAATTAQIQGVAAEGTSAKLLQENTFGTTGNTVGQQAQIDRNYAVKAIPLQIQALAQQAEVASAQGDATLAQNILTQAQDHLDTVFQIHQQDATNQYNYLTNLRNSVFEFASTEQQRQLAVRQKENDQAFTERQNSINNAQALAKTAIESGQASLAAQITALDPNSETYNADVSAYVRQIRVPQDAGGGGGLGAGAITGLTPEQQKDPFIQKMIASAGGKPITDTFAQSLNKGLSVLGQIGVLQTNVKDTNTGPITGLFRGANPWDTNAQTIKAQLNAIVPNLARGVYGEVGVLTDNDIKTYASTLPNLKSTEDVRNAVLGITVDLIGKSIKRTLEVNAANGKDVSGFVDLYTEMQNTRDSIFAQIPGYKGNGALALKDVGVTLQDEEVFNSVVETGNTIPSTDYSIGGFFSKIWKGITGK